MSKVLVLYYSAFGYVAIVANVIAEGARSAGAIADIKRVPEAAPAVADQGALFNPVQDVPVAMIEELGNYDAIIVGSPTRFGRLASPMAGFLEQAGELLSRGVLTGKVGGAFTSPSSVNGGQETASMSIITNLLHFGMIVVGPPYSASTIADTTGQRHPSALDLEGAWQQGRRIAEAAGKLSSHVEASAPDDQPNRDRKLGAANRKPGAAHRKPAAADRKPSAAEGKPGAVHRKPAAGPGAVRTRKR
jgi:NAD(P)H dehydrogenase (quinone)